MNSRLKKLFPLLAVFVVLLPVVLRFSVDLRISGVISLILNLVGWTLVTILFVKREALSGNLNIAFQKLGYKRDDASLESNFSKLITELERTNRVSFYSNLDENRSGGSLGSDLNSLANLCLDELDAKAVELSLFDKESGLWSQALMLGEPDSIATQSMLLEASNDAGALQSANQTGGEVAVEEMSFAGSMFGAIRVEKFKGESFSDSDRLVLRQLAVSGSLLMVDSKFTEELLLMKKLGDESLKAKTGFLANLSHEIRGPLSVILNGTELTRDGLCGPVTETQKETLQMIKDNGDHLLDLVNDVLDYAKVEAGKINVKPVEMSVKELLKDLQTLVRSQATTKKHKLVLDPVDEDLGIVCDKRHSRQILINFLTNAIKYTPEGGTVTLGAKRLKNEKAKIWIKDTGVGIPEEERAKVFGAFERVEDKYSIAQTGTGLGMTLTKKLAAVNGGSVDFTSEKGQGSTFWIVLPAVEIEKGEVAKERNKEGVLEELHGRGEKVLIVDHNDQTRSMYEQYMEFQGFEVINATSGSEVLKILRDEKIRLAVVESDMPDVAGEDIVLAIRSNPLASGIPIILLSSKAFVFDVEHFLKLGVDRCLSKPVELSELASTSRRLIDESKGR